MFFGLIIREKSDFNIHILCLQLKFGREMQQAFEFQRDAQLNTIVAQKQIFKCPNNNQAQLVCNNSKCLAIGLMCLSQKCVCINAHQKCQYIQLNRLITAIYKHQTKTPEDFRRSYKAVHQLIDGLIDQLSEIKRKLDLEEKYFRLQKQELKFISWFQDQNIEKINMEICGKTVNRIKQALQQKNIEYLMNSKEQIEQDFKLKKYQFDHLCNHIQSNYMKYDPIKVLRSSKIVNTINQKKLIRKWLTQTLNKNQLKYKLLFRASEHNFNVNQFHKRCDGIENTLVLVKNEFDKTIGGFNPNKWSSRWELINDQTGRTFIFSLNLKQKYKCTNPQNSIGCFKSYGPVFGGNGGHDIFLSDNANENNKSYCNFPHSYNLQVNGANKYQQNQKTYTLFAGATSGFFKVKQYQIYQIKVM